ncbi:MAG TPA: 30S ribosomal protein S4 [Candidatus Saccharimonadales bacterium]|jgi:small subunit ribosomal protein S4|nr:30S ribosomal protein S4 [Candidatus Saccharimonadales bacterium]
MARLTSSIAKQSRREGYALHPKAHKILARRPTPPGGQKGGGRPSVSSQYSIQLREKQKVKRLYGLLEKQFSNLVLESQRRHGSTGELLLQALEQRLDNVIYKSGFANSRKSSRQLVTHGHFQLNGHRVDIPSIKVVPGDEIIIRESSKKNNYFNNIDELSPPINDTPAWLKVDRKKFKISITGLPSREDAEPDINEQLIVEYYSR